VNFACTVRANTIHVAMGFMHSAWKNPVLETEK
jgi:hypothetical protein